MPIGNFLFSETSPSAAGGAASSQTVANAGSIYGAGVAAPLDDYDSIDITATFGGKTAGGASTGGTVDLYLQVSGDAGKTWVDAVHFAQAAANSAAVTYRCSLTARPQVLSDSPVVVGTGNAPALAANTIVQGRGFDRIRLWMVAGSGTTGGAPVSVIVTGHRHRVRELGG